MPSERPRRTWSIITAPARPWHVLLAGGIFLVFFFCRFAADSGLDYSDRYAHWFFIALLSATFAPYLTAAEPGGFWQFNRRLVVRYAVSALYTLVLFCGISLALAAIEKLLGVKVSRNAYGYLWIFAGYIFWSA